MRNSSKAFMVVGTIGVVLGGVWLLTRAPAEAPLVEDAWASIAPYLTMAYYLNPETGYWEAVFWDTRLVEGGTYSINVSQPCTLSYDGYYYELDAGWNTITWGKV